MTDETSKQNTPSSEKSYLDGFKNYLPESLKQFTWSDLTKLYSSKNQYNSDAILWTHFQYVNFNNYRKLFLINTYTNGFQIFDVDDPNDAREVISVIEDFPIKFVKFLHPPVDDDKDPLKDKRPVIAVVKCDENKEEVVSSIHLYSLRTKSYFHRIDFPGEISHITCNSKLLVVCLFDQIVWLDPVTFEKIIQFTCFPNPYSFDIVALGERWIAYPGNSPVPKKSYEFVTPNQSSFVEMSMGVAEKAASGIVKLGDLGVNYLKEKIGTEKQSDSQKKEEKKIQERIDETYAGTIIIRDIRTRKVIAHFRSHWEPISALTFDPSGTLLVTASVRGQSLNVYQILPSCTGEMNPNTFRHLYILKRGVTSAMIRDIQFSINSKWMTVSSSRGTTHIYAINPTGGHVNISSHSSVTPKGMTSSTVFKQEQPEARFYNEFISQKPNLPISLSAITRIKNGISLLPGVETNPKAVFHSIATTFFSAKQKKTERLVISTNRGEVKAYELIPSHKIVDGESHLVVDVVEHCKNELKRTKQGEYRVSTLKSLMESPREKVQEEETPEDITTRWIANVEIETYAPRSVPLWMTGQIKFLTYEKNVLYPSLAEFSKTEDILKSLYIQKQEPVPVTYFNDGKMINTKPSAPPFNETISKAMETPISQPLKKPMDAEWLKINTDDILPHEEPVPFELKESHTVKEEKEESIYEQLKKAEMFDDTDNYFTEETQYKPPEEKSEKKNLLAQSITSMNYFGDEKNDDDEETEMMYNELRYNMGNQIMKAAKKRDFYTSHHEDDMDVLKDKLMDMNFSDHEGFKQGMKESKELRTSKIEGNKISPSMLPVLQPTPLSEIEKKSTLQSIINGQDEYVTSDDESSELTSSKFNLKEFTIENDFFGHTEEKREKIDEKEVPEVKKIPTKEIENNKPKNEPKSETKNEPKNEENQLMEKLAQIESHEEESEDSLSDISENEAIPM